MQSEILLMVTWSFVSLNLFIRIFFFVLVNSRKYIYHCTCRSLSSSYFAQSSFNPSTAKCWTFSQSHLRSCNFKTLKYDNDCLYTDSDKVSLGLHKNWVTLLVSRYRLSFNDIRNTIRAHYLVTGGCESAVRVTLFTNCTWRLSTEVSEPRLLRVPGGCVSCLIASRPYSCHPLRVRTVS
jgi:hypothetical protein